LIWILLVAVVFVGGGAWMVARTLQTRLIVAALGVGTVATYWFVGHPGMADEPLEMRLAQIERQLTTNPQAVDARAVIAVVEHKIRERPDDPMGYVLVARAYKSLAVDAQMKAMQLNEAGDQQGAGREAASSQDSADKAEQAFVDYLKRGGDDPGAMSELADLRFTRTTDVDEFTTTLYQSAFAANPDQVRFGFLAGIGLWKLGKKAEAEALWADVDKRTPAEAPIRQMYAAMRQMFGVDQPPTP
jgi:cytochrome c-type biogenesis protein CcmH/NrfG